MDKKNYTIHLIYIALAVVTFIAYEPILHNSFISFDDDSYIYNNPNVTSGLSLKNIVWAFTSIHSNNYHPLTSMSHMLDCTLYKLRPGWHHLTNLIFHVTNTALLFFVFSKMTKRMWASAIVAALFALHPLHVESVAWASERKDVLCAFFWLLTMFAYWRYTLQNSKGRYILTLIMFTLGLLSKPMIVTLPFVLLLLDYWPLDRFKNTSIFKLIIEKIPFFILSGIVSIITLVVQGKMGLVKDVAVYQLPWRIENTITSYVIYIEKLFWPFDLAIFYPHPKGTTPLLEVLISLIILIGITILVLRTIRSKPYLAIGWFWFIGTLVPVIGLFQVGMQAWANRYTYIPYIGLFIALTWLIADLTAKINSKKVLCAVLASLLLFALAVKTYVQTIYWQNNRVLYAHAIDAVENNWWAYGFLGTALGLEGEYAEAEKMLTKSLEIFPDNATMYAELVKIYLYRENWTQAIKMYEKLLGPLPDDINSERNVNTRRFDYDMLRNFYVNANVNMAIALKNVGRYEESEKRFKEALHIVPGLPLAEEGLKEISEIKNKASEPNDAIVNY